ncbi:MAG: hypothetical protein DWP97_13655 [Calditrichaeota bacterium]|nr:MAG: hypothetical protein DWP97_13655 [Calditrichota bacterium]
MKQFFKNIWEKWKVIAHKIGQFNTKVIVTVIYFLMISPLGALFRLFGWNPLDHSFHSDKNTNWKDVQKQNPDFESLKRQS